MNTVDVTILQPGDTLLYKPSNWVGLWIAFKTWEWLSHVEMYIGNGRAIGARSTGVRVYPLRTSELVCVRRPLVPFNMQRALYVFEHGDPEKGIPPMDGQDYDTLGLLVFYWAAHHGSKKKAFCSETQTRVYRFGGFEPFNPDYDADRVSPAQFLQTGTLRTVWQSKPIPQC